MAQNTLGYTALDIAKWFINATDRDSGDAITHLKVQKLIYYAQGWAIAHLGKPLFEESLQAWAHGPVAPSVWNYFREARYEALPEQRVTKRIASDVSLLLASVNDKYGTYPAKRLERMTHAERPWKNARKDLPPEARGNGVISHDDIVSYFQSIKP